MIELLAEAIIVSFAMGGLAGAIIALNLKSKQKAAEREAENSLQP